MSDVDLINYNKTELTNLVRTKTGFIVKRSVDINRLIQIINGESPLPDELASTNDTRKKLQLFIEKNWATINSQLPCKGENRGKCTIYPCPEGRHIDCHLSAEPHMKIHDL